MTNNSMTNRTVVANYWSLVLAHWSLEIKFCRLLVVACGVAIDATREVAKDGRGHRSAEHLRAAVAEENRHDTGVPAAELVAVAVILCQRQRRVRPADPPDGKRVAAAIDDEIAAIQDRRLLLQRREHH